jgi:hypothetical protein
MNRLSTRKTPGEQLRDAAVDAALSALSDDAGKASDKRALTGPRAVVTGAVLYTAVRAALVGGRFVRAQRASEQAARDAEPDRRRPQNEDAGKVASSKTSGPKRTSARANDPRPSLTLPNRRWPRMATERR